MVRVSMACGLKQIPPLLLLCTIVLLAGCSNVKTEPSVIAVAEPEPVFSLRQDEFFGPRPDLVSIEGIHRLTPEQEKHFYDFFNSRKELSSPAHERVVDYLEAQLENFEYSAQTYTAAESLANRSGNCLSLAILTTAIAKLANVDVGYQLADSDPVFELNGGLVVKGLHVRTILYDAEWIPDEGRITLRRPGLRLDYFSTSTERFAGSLTEKQYVARYYRNLAVDAIARHEYNLAYWLTVEAIALEPLSSETFNTMAVIYRRIGKLKKSEEVYLYGIENMEKKLTLLKNYRFLLTQQNRVEEIKQVSQQIAELDDPSPFHWLRAARDSYEKGNYQEAIALYKKAVKLAPYLHEAYFGLAIANYRIGRFSSAKRYLRNALDRAYRRKTRSMYEAKLAVLTELPDRKNLP